MPTPFQVPDEPNLFTSFLASLLTPTDRMEAIAMVAIGVVMTSCLSVILL